MRKYVAALVFVCLYHFIFSQHLALSGKITGNNEPLPFANVYLKGTTIGVSSNDEGRYSIKLEKGKYNIVFQYIGYAKQEITVDLNENKTLDIQLKLDGIALNEIVVDAGEDPAYPIMRKAIKKRKYYVNPVEQYSCQSYIKGMERLKSMSESFKKLYKLGTGEKTDSTDLGVVYLSESESNYYYKRSDQEKEVMFSSRVSGESKSFSFNQLRQMKVNFYENLVPLGGLSPRPMVSPLNGNAFLFYKFFLLGTFTEDGKTYNKIKVKPKRETDPCFSGVIYIQENSWRLTGADLMLTKKNKLNFVDTLIVRQLFAPVNGDSTWMPVNYNFSFTFKILGISGDGYFNAVVKNYNLHPGLPNNFFSDEVLVIEKGANKKDSLYWNQNRALPLTREENTDYHKKDSSEKVQNTDRYKDSVDRVSNKFKPTKLIMGYTYRNTKKGISLGIPGLVKAGIQYNTVEGINLSYNFSMVKTNENFREQQLTGQMRYGFSNYLWGGALGYSHLYNPKKFSRFGIRAKSLVTQFNQQDPISPLINSIYTLFLNDNYMKLFKETAVDADYHTELINGLYFNAEVKYAEREALKNSSDRLFIDDKNKLFTSNNPLNPASDDQLFKTNTALTTELSFTIRFKQKYVTLPDRKITAGSKYPRITLTYKKAIPTLNATADYDLMSASVYDHIQLGLLGKFSYRVTGGSFLQSKNLQFTDYKHFIGNQTIINAGNYMGSFRLLPYYAYSANKWFIEAHAEHHFNGFIINKIPFIKKLKVQEVLGGHLLMNNVLKHYYEINFGIEHIFNILRVDYVLAYGINSKVKSGLTFGIVTNF